MPHLTNPIKAEPITTKAEMTQWELTWIRSRLERMKRAELTAQERHLLDKVNMLLRKFPELRGS